LIGNSLVSFRSADVSYTAIPTVSTNDANFIRSNYSAMDANEDEQYYRQLN
jgi:hypothetical protein